MVKIKNEKFSHLSFLGLTVSLIKPSKAVGSEISEETKKQIEDNGYKIVFKKDDDAIGAIFLLMAVMLAGWFYTLYLSSQNPTGVWWIMPDFIAIGLLTYLIGIGFSIWKEGL